jgi:hypothetical protein
MSSSALRIINLNGAPQGEFGAYKNENTQSHSFMAQSVHGSPALPQKLAQDAIEQDPVLGQLRNENPALTDPAPQMPRVEAEHAPPTFQKDREAIQRVSVAINPMVPLFDYS